MLTICSSAARSGAAMAADHCAACSPQGAFVGSAALALLFLCLLLAPLGSERLALCEAFLQCGFFHLGSKDRLPERAATGHGRALAQRWRARDLPLRLLGDRRSDLWRVHVFHAGCRFHARLSDELGSVVHFDRELSTREVESACCQRPGQLDATTWHALWATLVVAHDPSPSQVDARPTDALLRKDAMLVMLLHQPLHCTNVSVAEVHLDHLVRSVVRPD
mmetsp:Transcript_93898/g.243053  ORF Transcript_93898/g.243053 Transcript_93898/m.243053 type:complete len:221 (-) Transcript_93898:866-1528(-)